MSPDPNTYAEIEEMIRCDTSPVGIDAKKTHVHIIYMLQKIEERLAVLESQVQSIEQSR